MNPFSIDSAKALEEVAAFSRKLADGVRAVAVRLPQPGADQAGAEHADADEVRHLPAQHVGEGEHGVLAGGVRGAHGVRDAET